MILLVLKFHHIPRKLNVPLAGLLFKELTDSTYQVLHSLKKKIFPCGVMWKLWIGYIMFL